MKTTFDLPEGLLLQAKRIALERRTTLRQLVVNGLNRELTDPSPEDRPMVYPQKLQDPLFACEPTAMAESMGVEDLISLEKDILAEED